MRTLCLAFALSALALPALADDFHVDGLNGSDSNAGTTADVAFRTIQRGVNATVSGRFDTVHILPGTYQESVVITRDQITLIAQGTVTLEDVGVAIQINSTAVTIEGITIRNCGWGIQWYGGPMCLIRRCRLLENVYGLFTGGTGSLALRECDICCQNQYGIVSQYPADIERCTIVANGVGVSVWGSSTALRNCVVAYNTTNGIGSLGGTVILAHNDFFQNGSGSDGDYDGFTPGRFDLHVDPEFVDRDSANFALKPSSPLINAGRGPDELPVTIGAHEIGVLFSGSAAATASFSQWTDASGASVTGASIELSLDPDGFLRLKPPTSAAAALSPVVDLGDPSAVTVNAILKAVENVLEPSGQRRVVDADNLTAAREFRIRASSTSFGPLDASPAWVVMTSNADHMELHGRYVQVEVTLTTQGK